MSIDARESAPIDATPDMFSKTPNESFIGYRAIATPGLLSSNVCALLAFSLLALKFLQS